ncbi:phospho-2-dehydro-3-deoxyheptonate aldolase [Microbacterium sorbitolivorans]|uniref:Phospho-2-dehydro-3-deoxyheptonate aldolase n=1 Tax=Microbacterium sorbitolivorans TaxID=1867410 RepID=A0A367Y297_9MICO|nr:3-deoxy-7-phosphoheptulonate synthase [Microbacterium sorbitolivorans]RCK60016.1 3-deoxy-7-phosphoheptulonate synthase [Microbacterium sorbitolivorans]GGF42025.1 phospho-2-dehydro-3-deoxyheptonate aldolase [Microbacterium sorbitolivorans]
MKTLDSTSDVHVASSATLPSPDEIASELPIDDARAALVARARDEVRAIMNGEDDRLLVVVGPCSIHDPEAGLEYAERLTAEAEHHRDDLLIVMRAYFEKPRTTVGWKGLINDPHLDGSHDIETGLRMARAFLRDVTGMGMPCATEFLEPISPQYTADLISWGAIGARTTESQIHRQLASGLSMPIGFKNGTDGGLQVALDAASAASAPQAFLGIGSDGRASLVSTTGNPDTSIILRGGADGPNFDAEHVRRASERLDAAGRGTHLVVDASHGNSGKDHVRQAEVAGELAAQIAAGSHALAGVMLESNLVAGAQKLDVTVGPAALVRGQSVTDACMGWDASATALEQLAAAVRARRAV